MITIDGSFGEGGGQILRSSLALSLWTGTPFRIEQVRAGRKKPGLMRQHLTAVQAAVAVGQARVEGAAIGSTELEFCPDTVKPGEYHFAVGTAGSTTLVLQTVLPALVCAASQPSKLTLEGGTHNPFAPPFGFLVKAFLPLLNRMGPTVTATLERPGFYPAGGGRFTVTIQPAKLRPIELLERGEIRRHVGRAVVANLPRHIAEREAQHIGHKMGWPASDLVVEQVGDTPGPGNLVTIELECEHVTEVFTGFGEQGVKAEAVAEHAVQECRRYLVAGVPVGEYLADQLLLPLALAGGGAFRTLGLSRHATTHLELIRRFLPTKVAVKERSRDDVVVQLG